MTSLWEQFRELNGPRPGGRGAQARWDKKWAAFKAEEEAKSGQSKVRELVDAMVDCEDRAILCEWVIELTTGLKIDDPALLNHPDFIQMHKDYTEEEDE